MRPQVDVGFQPTTALDFEGALAKVEEQNAS